MHDVGDHRRAVVVALDVHPAGRRGALGREPTRTGVHGLAEQLLELAVLGVGRQLAGLRSFETEHPREGGGEGEVGLDVHGLGESVDPVEELRERDPVPRQPGLHRVVGDGLDPGHGEHGSLPKLGSHRREPEPTVADDQRRDAVPARQGAVRVPEELGVVVGVEVDEPRGHVAAGGVEDTTPVGAPEAAYLGDPPVADPQIGPVPGRAGAVDDRPVLDDHVETGRFGAGHGPRPPGLG